MAPSFCIVGLLFDEADFRDDFLIGFFLALVEYDLVFLEEVASTGVICISPICTTLINDLQYQPYSVLSKKRNFI